MSAAAPLREVEVELYGRRWRVLVYATITSAPTARDVVVREDVGFGRRAYRGLAVHGLRLIQAERVGDEEPRVFETYVAGKPAEARDG